MRSSAAATAGTRKREAVAGHKAAMEKAVLEHGWDGEWFLRAYDAFGNKIGSHECDEGQIYIEPQGFLRHGGRGRERRAGAARTGFRP